MKKIFLTILLYLIYLSGFSQINFTIKNFHEQPVFARYILDKAYPVDTLSTSKNGEYSFNKKIDSGIYILLMGQKYVEFPVGENQRLNFSLDYNQEEIQKSLHVTGCNDNVLFQEFLMLKNAEEMARFSKQNANSIQDDFIKAYLKSVTPIIPPAGANDTVRFYYFRNHIWDGVNLTIPQMLNSPVIAKKLDYFFNNMIVQNPDTVIFHIKKLMVRPMADTIKHYALDFLIHYTFESKIMGMEKAFVWLSENYFVNGKCFWIDEKALKTITEQYELNRFCLVGQKGKNLKLTDSENKPFQLEQLNCDFTLLLIYDIGCGSCKKVVEELNLKYSDLFLKGVEIVALNTETDRGKWISYIKEHKISDWHNVMDFDNSTNYHTFYGVQQTPIIYLLDKQNNIIGKKLTVDQVFQILSTLKDKTQKS